MSDKPVAFHDFPPEAFPFTIEIIDDELGVVWKETVEGVAVLEVPGFGMERAYHRKVLITWADGTTSEARTEDL